MDTLSFSAIYYKAVRERVRSEDPHIDEQCLADTLEGISDLPEILTAIVRAALTDEALANGLKGRISEMEDRLNRLRERAAKRRQIVKDTMVAVDLKKLEAPDFTVSVRPGIASLVILEPTEVPSLYWEPGEPRLNRKELLSDLKHGVEIAGAALSDPEPVLSVRTR
jgi:hypothetical protein